MHLTRTVILSLVIALIGLTCAGQIDTPRIAPAADTNDLYVRAAASDLVIVGSVVHGKVVSKRVAPDDIEGLKASLNSVFQGLLYTIRIDNVLCSQENFVAGGTSVRRRGNNDGMVHVFIPADEPLFRGNLRQESFVKGRQYLLFLVPAPPEEKENWVKSLELDPTTAYYRGEEHSRGVIDLTSATSAPPVYEKVVALCKALQPAELAAKLRSLRSLQDSQDPVLQREATIAITTLQAQKR